MTTPTPTPLPHCAGYPTHPECPECKRRLYSAVKGIVINGRCAYLIKKEEKPT